MTKLSIVNFAPLTNQTYIQLLICLRASQNKVSVQNKISEECLVEVHEPMTVFVELDRERDKHFLLPERCFLQAHTFSCHRSNGLDNVVCLL